MKSTIEKYRTKASKKNRKCWIPYCKKTAINSHLLHKKGIITNIAENNHIYEFIYYSFQDPPAKFKKTGINDAFTFKGFCAYHDNIKFEPIEKRKLDLNDYTSHLLFAYRIIINEARKKEIAIDYCTSIIEDKSINTDKNILSDSVTGFRLGLLDSKKLLKEINDELKTPTQENFTFYHFKFWEKLPICASGLFTFETTEDMLDLNQLHKSFDYSLNEIFLNILPFDNYTSITIGSKTKASYECLDYINQIIEMDNKQLKKTLSDILIGRMENWIISPSFYRKLSVHENTLSKIYMYTGLRLNEAESIDFNLFDYV